MLRVYISADYDVKNGDRDVVDVLNQWSKDKLHKVDFIDTAQVYSGSVSQEPDCRICDLKAEFNRQINASSHVIIVVGDKTAQRTAGSNCERNPKHRFGCKCTPYNQNTNGQLPCKISGSLFSPTKDVGIINRYSYIQHEFEQAQRRGKKIIVVYNSLNKQLSWLPNYMKGYEYISGPFWIRNQWGERRGNYCFVRRALGYE